MHTLKVADLSDKLSATSIAITCERESERGMLTSAAARLVMQLDGTSGPSRELELTQKAMKIVGLETTT
jgi:hypothetical protein